MNNSTHYDEFQRMAEKYGWEFVACKPVDWMWRVFCNKDFQDAVLKAPAKEVRKYYCTNEARMSILAISEEGTQSIIDFQNKLKVKFESEIE